MTRFLFLVFVIVFSSLLQAWGQKIEPIGNSDLPLKSIFTLQMFLDNQSKTDDIYLTWKDKSSYMSCIYNIKGKYSEPVACKMTSSDGKEVEVTGSSMLGGSIVLFGKKAESKEIVFYGQKFNKNGSPKGELKKLNSIPKATKRASAYDFDYYLSDKQDGLCCFSTLPSDNELKIHLVTYDGDLNKIWERPVSFPTGSEIDNIKYAGKGVVYITVSNPKNAKSPYTVVTIMDEKSLNLANKGVVVGDTYYYFYRKPDSKTAYQLYKIR